MIEVTADFRDFEQYGDMGRLVLHDSSGEHGDLYYAHADALTDELTAEQVRDAVDKYVGVLEDFYYATELWQAVADKLNGVMGA